MEEEKLIELDFKEKLFITTISWIALACVGALVYFKPEIIATFYAGVFLFLFLLSKKNKALIKNHENTVLIESIENVDKLEKPKYKYKNKLI